MDRRVSFLPTWPSRGRSPENNPRYGEFFCSRTAIVSTEVLDIQCLHTAMFRRAVPVDEYHIRWMKCTWRRLNTCGITYVVTRETQLKLPNSWKKERDRERFAINWRTRTQTRRQLHGSSYVAARPVQLAPSVAAGVNQGRSPGARRQFANLPRTTRELSDFENDPRRFPRSCRSVWKDCHDMDRCQFHRFDESRTWWVTILLHCVIHSVFSVERSRFACLSRRLLLWIHK